MGNDSEKKDFYKNILDNLYDGVYFCDWERKITYWNKAAEKMTGYKSDDMINSHCWDNVLMHTNMKGEKLCDAENCPAVTAMKEGKMVEAEVYLKHRDGYRLPVVTRISPIKDDGGKIIGAIEIFNDNSAKIAAFQKIEKLEELAFIDPLTGVGNRRYAEIKIHAKLEEMSRYAWVGEFGMLFIDIDHFKLLNDNFGHDTGDEMLKMIAKTIMKNLREEDFIGRWGGEEFIAVISNVDRKQLLAIAEKLRALTASLNINVSGSTVRSTISIGATVAKREDDMESLVRRADRIMYDSKNNGRNTVTIG
jgi:diguanylate cyclase (GGDEF)-like protein/PAS domain S-box-containing protein